MLTSHFTPINQSIEQLEKTTIYTLRPNYMKVYPIPRLRARVSQDPTAENARALTSNPLRIHPQRSKRLLQRVLPRDAALDPGHRRRDVLAYALLAEQRNEAGRLERLARPALEVRDVDRDTARLRCGSAPPHARAA